jgi:hypothetical protein
MRRTLLLGLCALLVLASGATAWAITRINGNQLLEGVGEYGFANKVLPNQTNAAPRLILSLGQGVMARGQLPDSAAPGQMAVTIGFGLGYDIAKYVICPIPMTGDINADGVINASDIINLINYLFLEGPPPQPCAASGDINCSGNVTSGDCMELVAYVFKSGPAPCNVCTLIPDVWPCQ